MVTYLSCSKASSIVRVGGRYDEAVWAAHQAALQAGIDGAAAVPYPTVCNKKCV